jgi:acetylglutamate kinase
MNPTDENSLASSLTEAQIKDLIARGVISGGMLPKVQACIEALDKGVKKAHIIDGRLPHSLLLEIFTDRGVGTMILK